MQLAEGGYWRGARLNPRTLRLGELEIGAKEFGAITGRQSVSKKESNILRAASDEEPARKKIRQKAEAAIRWLNLPRNMETELVETVERNAVSLTTRYRREALSVGRKIHVSLEKVVEYSLLTEAKKVGRTIREVQEALANAGFNIKLQHFCLRIAVPPDHDMSSVNMYVNGWKREEKDFRPKEAGEGPFGKEYTVNVQAFLSDAITQRGRIEEESWIEVHFDNAVILPDESAVLNQREEWRTVGSRRWYSNEKVAATTSGSNRVRFLQKDPYTARLKLNAEKCFALFRDMNNMLDRSVQTKEQEQADGAISSSKPVQIESTIRQHLFLPSKKFPASATLMQRASCLSKVERRSVELFREFLKNSQGRSLRTLAQDALIQADQEVYSSLPESVRVAMRGYVSTLPFQRRDRSYTGIRGLLIPSEAFRS